MEEEFSGTESDNTADTAEFSQDEFGNVEVEGLAIEVEASGRSYDEDDSLEPYTDEPLADEEWLAQFPAHSKTLILMGHNYYSLSIDATIMVSKNCPITGEHVGIIFVTQ